MIRSAVLIQYTRVTDGRTDGQTELAWHIRSIAYILSRVKKTENEDHAYIFIKVGGRLRGERLSYLSMYLLYIVFLSFSQKFSRSVLSLDCVLCYI